MNTTHTENYEELIALVHRALQTEGAGSWSFDRLAELLQAEAERLDAEAARCKYKRDSYSARARDCRSWAVKMNRAADRARIEEGAELAA